MKHVFAIMFAVAIMMAASSAKAEDGFDFGVDSGSDYADYGPADPYDATGFEVNFYDFDFGGAFDDYGGSYEN